MSRECQDCHQPIPYGHGWGSSVCNPCRGKRTAVINRAKLAAHGPAYFTSPSRKTAPAKPKKEKPG